MKNFYLIDYLKENYPINMDLLDSLKFQLDGHIYWFGHQFKGYFEDTKNESMLVSIKEKLKDVFRCCRGYLRAHPVNDKPKILANPYFTYNKELENLGFNVFLSPWIKQFVRGYPPRRIKKELDYLSAFFRSKNFNEIIGQPFLDRIIEVEGTLKQYYANNDFRALCVPYDLPFFERCCINIFPLINRPSFIFLHGLTQGYDGRDDRANYLIVWGEKTKENYVKAGMNSNKIFVSGHPYFKEFNRRELKFGFENVLVLEYPAISSHNSKEVFLQDRGISILYLYSIQNILKKLGIKHVRLRPHPCENPKWYLKYIDSTFFKLDSMPLTASLSQSSLIIGPFSSIILDSIYYGINYTVYIPSINNYAWGSKHRLVNPFDGSDSRVPVAKSEEELLCILKNKIKINAEVFSDYVKTPFDISFMKKLILEH